MDTETASLVANWTQLRRRADDACREAGREPASVQILPVSKTFGAQAIRAAALALGQQRFGENRVQEIRDKSATLADCAIAWVVIGHLQTNKVRDVARLASEVQSLDRLELAEALHRRLQAEGRTIEVLVQVRTSPEPGKHGLAPALLPGFLDVLRRYDTLRLRGLMTMAIQSVDPIAVRNCFRALRELRDRAVLQGHELPRLSMGMSGDFPLAIAEGSTEVRIGTAIFGSRSHPASSASPGI